jgi:hypothetical protein
MIDSAANPALGPIIQVRLTAPPRSINRDDSHAANSFVRHHCSEDTGNRERPPQVGEADPDPHSVLIVPKDGADNVAVNSTGRRGNGCVLALDPNHIASRIRAIKRSCLRRRGALPLVRGHGGLITRRLAA